MTDAPLAPGIRWTRQLRAEKPGYLVLVKLGDFWEAFEQDAQVLAQELQLTLTQRAGVPMAGFPHWTLTRYLKQLIAAGHKVTLAHEVDMPAA